MSKLRTQIMPPSERQPLPRHSRGLSSIGTTACIHGRTLGLVLALFLLLPACFSPKISTTLPQSSIIPTENTKGPHRDLSSQIGADGTDDAPGDTDPDPSDSKAPQIRLVPQLGSVLCENDEQDKIFQYTIENASADGVILSRVGTNPVATELLAPSLSDELKLKPLEIYTGSGTVDCSKLLPGTSVEIRILVEGTTPTGLSNIVEVLLPVSRESAASSP